MNYRHGLTGIQVYHLLGRVRPNATGRFRRVGMFLTIWLRLLLLLGRIHFLQTDMVEKAGTMLWKMLVIPFRRVHERYARLRLNLLLLLRTKDGPESGLRLVHLVLKVI